MSEVDDQVAKWVRWIEGDIKNDVIGMHHRRMVWRDVDEILRANPEVSELPSMFWDFHHDNYATAQAIAVRRQADRDFANILLGVPDRGDAGRRASSNYKRRTPARARQGGFAAGRRQVAEPCGFDPDEATSAFS